jgi:hypothetical protein
MAATCAALVVIICKLFFLLVLEKRKNARVRKSAPANHIVPNGNNAQAINQNNIVPQINEDQFTEENDMYGRF